MERLLSEADALAALQAIPGMRWRSFQRVDLPDIADFYAHCERFDRNPERHSLAGLEEFWDSSRSRPDEDALIGDGPGRIVATAWAGCNRVLTDRRGVHLGGAVKPDRPGEGIRRAILRWQLAHGVEWERSTRKQGYGPLVMRLYAPTEQTDVRDLAERHGLAPECFFVELSRRLSEPVAAHPPEGIRMVDWDGDRSSEIHRVVDAAFRDHWGHVDRTDEMWREAITGPAFRPEWSVLAVEAATGSVVGAVINCAFEQDWEVNGFTEGYTEELAVARGHRGKGVATALLRESMSLRLIRNGCDRAWRGRSQPLGCARAVSGARL